MRGLVCAFATAVSGTLLAQPAADPFPKSVEEFRNAVRNVLSDTNVPGAGIALVRTSGIEWAGGIGVADRAANTPVTADTHFRVGSISKTFIASAIVQLYLDGRMDLDMPIAYLAPELRIDNAWEPTDPVRVIHLLQHTAGFDDTHFNELYNHTAAPDLPLESVLAINPASRVVRWRPGTRMSYSNPGYAVAGYIIEKVSGRKYEDRIAEHIFTPVGMTSSSLYLRPEDHTTLAKGYTSRDEAAAPYTPAFLRPAGSLLTTASDMGRFVHLLLNRGKTAENVVVDPDSLSDMERPQTTLASGAGLRTGYGSGLATYDVDGFPMLVHSGGIEGFSSLFGYSRPRFGDSPSGDAGFVVLLNSTVSGEARLRIASLAVRYLKAGVDPPVGSEADVPEDRLRSLVGYYHDANPRSQATAFLGWLFNGQTISANGKRLRSVAVFGDAIDLIPVSETMFRLPHEAEATRVFTTDEDGVPILAGGTAGQLYAERRPRWRVDIVRWPVMAAAGLMLTPVLMIAPWIVHARRAKPSGFWWLKVCLLVSALAFALPAAAVMDATGKVLGTRNIFSVSFFLGTVLLPAAAILACVFTHRAWRAGAGTWLRAYAMLISIAAVIISAYLASWGMIGFRSWAY